MTKKDQVLIVGGGAVGLVAAYTLEYNELAETTVVLRSGYKKATEQGFQINSCEFGQVSNWRPTRITKDVEEAVAQGQQYDYIFVSLKNLPDSTRTCEDIVEPAVVKCPNATIILCQNGIDIEKPMIERFPGRVVLGCVVLIACTNIDCVLVQKTPENVQIGLFENPTITDKEAAHKSLDRFIQLYQSPGKNVVKKDGNVRLTRWQKILYNAAINTTTALVNLDCSRAAMGGAKENLYRPIMREIYQIAAAEGCVLAPELENMMMTISDGLFYTPSMLVDVRQGRLIEFETIVGNPVRIAKNYGIQTPYLCMIYSLLQLVQFRTKESLGMIVVDESVQEKKDTEQFGKGF